MHVYTHTYAFNNSQEGPCTQNQAINHTGTWGQNCKTRWVHRSPNLYLVDFYLKVRCIISAQISQESAGTDHCSHYGIVSD